MFIRQCFRNRDRKGHACWALVESYCTDTGPRQRVVGAVSYVQITRERDLAVANEERAVKGEQLAQQNEARAVKGEQQAKESEQKAVAAQQKQRETALAASKRFAMQAVEQASLNKLEPAKRRAADAELVAPGGPWAPFAEGAIAMARVDYPLVMELYRKAAASPDGDQPEIQAALAEALAQQRDLTGAEALLANLEGIDDWRSVLSAGRILYAAHKWDACQKPLSPALELMNQEKDRPQESVIEVERLLAAAPAQKACCGTMSRPDRGAQRRCSGINHFANKLALPERPFA